MATLTELGTVRTASPCNAVWADMTGDERVRLCALCKTNVYNFAHMTNAEVRQLLLERSGRVCARFYTRSDGTVLTRDCPEGLARVRRGLLLTWAAVCSLVAVVMGGLFTPAVPGPVRRASVLVQNRLESHAAHITQQVQVSEPIVSANRRNERLAGGLEAPVRRDGQ